MLALVQIGAPGGPLPARDVRRPAAARGAGARAGGTPAILLLDEPFAALDKNLRLDMQIEIKRIQRRAGITCILVTHDQEEAMSHGRPRGRAAIRDAWSSSAHPPISTTCRHSLFVNALSARPTCFLAKLTAAAAWTGTGRDSRGRRVARAHPGRQPAPSAAVRRSASGRSSSGWPMQAPGCRARSRLSMPLGAHDRPRDPPRRRCGRQDCRAARRRRGQHAPGRRVPLVPADGASPTLSSCRPAAPPHHRTVFRHLNQEDFRMTCSPPSAAGQR